MKQSFKEKLIHFFKTKDRFAAHNKIEATQVKVGWAQAQTTITQQHLNGVGIGHGGIIFTLADVAFGLAANSHGRVAVTMGADISFFDAAKEGMTITATAEELSLRHTIASYLVSVTDEEGNLLATMKCQAYRKNEIEL